MKTKNIFLTLALVLISTFTFAQGIITGSKHDFKGAAWNTGGQICITCHTPHNAIASVGPLWNHTVTAASFTLYTNVISPTFNGSTAQPAGTSKLCLSCHDGTVDLDAFTGKAGTASGRITGATLLGINLTTHHPVSFTYDTALATADGGLKNPSVTLPVSSLLFAGKLECASCHDAHNNGPAGTKLLRATNAASALCLTCHNK